MRYVPGTSTATFAIAYEGDARRDALDALGDPWAPGDRAAAPDDRPLGARRAARALRLPTGHTRGLARRHRLSSTAQGLVRAPELGPLQLNADFDPAVAAPRLGAEGLRGEADVIGDLRAWRAARSWSPTAHGVNRLHRRAARGQCPPGRLMLENPTGAGDMFTTAYVSPATRLRSERGRPPRDGRRRLGAVRS